MDAHVNGRKMQFNLEWLTRPLIVNLARFRHRKTQGEYTLLIGARVSASTRPLQEGDVVVVYVDHIGQGHVRLHEEFHGTVEDGLRRFEAIE